MSATGKTRRGSVSFSDLPSSSLDHEGRAEHSPREVDPGAGRAPFSPRGAMRQRESESSSQPGSAPERHVTLASGAPAAPPEWRPDGQPGFAVERCTSPPASPRRAGDHTLNLGAGHTLTGPPQRSWREGPQRRVVALGSDTSDSSCLEGGSRAQSSAEAVDAIQQRMVADVEELARELELAVRQQVTECHEQALQALWRENKALHERLAAADEALLGLMQRGPGVSSAFPRISVPCPEKPVALADAPVPAFAPAPRLAEAATTPQEALPRRMSAPSAEKPAVVVPAFAFTPHPAEAATSPREAFPRRMSGPSAEKPAVVVPAVAFARRPGGGAATLREASPRRLSGSCAERSAAAAAADAPVPAVGFSPRMAKAATTPLEASPRRVSGARPERPAAMADAPVPAVALSPRTAEVVTTPREGASAAAAADQSGGSPPRASFAHAMGDEGSGGRRTRVEEHVHVVAEPQGERSVRLSVPEPEPGEKSNSSGRRSSGWMVAGLRQRGLQMMSLSVSASPSETSPVRGFCQRLVGRWQFEGCFAILIMLNCAFMGAQAHMEVTGDLPLPRWFGAMEHIFTALFTIEVICRLSAEGFKAFYPITNDGKANFTDLILVVFAGILQTWVIPLLSLITGLGNTGESLKALSALRAIRVMRFLRIFKKIPAFREAWMLVRGLGDSVRTLFWTIVVIGFVTYVFALLALVLIASALVHMREGTEDLEQEQELDQLLELYGGLDRMMNTLIQVTLMDNVWEFLRLTNKYLDWSWAFFFAYIAISCLVLMNLITAVIVEHAMANSQEDHDHAVAEKEAKQKKQIGELRHMFSLMDLDDSGTLSWQEFRNSFDDPVIRRSWMLLDFGPEECKELFSLLDDGDGEIAMNEFFDGLGRMRGAAQAKDVFRLQKGVLKLTAVMEQVLRYVHPAGLPGSPRMHWVSATKSTTSHRSEL